MNYRTTRQNLRFVLGVLTCTKRERSLLYVGATRARDMLAISWNKEASPYLPKAGAR